VVSSILGLLLNPSTFGQAYNLCQSEAPSLVELLSLIAEILGAQPRLVPVAAAEIRGRGLDPVALSPFSGAWMSLLDPAKATSELGLDHTPLQRYLETIITCHLAHPPVDAPAGYERRGEEIALAGMCGA
jgi:nucleoside-diphosphate-sugar epimerase